MIIGRVDEANIASISGMAVKVSASSLTCINFVFSPFSFFFCSMLLVNVIPLVAAEFNFCIFIVT
jgi:hypothetical protein